jgi:thiol:disulfide interchange protein DsbA
MRSLKTFFLVVVGLALALGIAWYVTRTPSPTPAQQPPVAEAPKPAPSVETKAEKTEEVEAPKPVAPAPKQTEEKQKPASETEKETPKVVPAAAPAIEMSAGKEYRVLPLPQPADSGKNVEVIEFFWYGCPHCNNMQAPLDTWLRTKATDVIFKRQPAAFDNDWLQLARAYYAIEAMRLVDKLHLPLFAAIHDKRELSPKALIKDATPLFDWVAKQGVDRQKFMDTYNSFGVTARTQRTVTITSNYDVPGTPALIVDGRYLTAPSLVLNPDNSLNYPRFFQVLDQLIAKARQSRAGK